MAFDSLAYARQLQAAGVPEPQATAQAEALADAFRDQEATLATKADVAELRADFAELGADVRTEIAELRADMRTEFAQLEPRFSRIDSQFAQLEPRFSQIDSQFAQLEPRFSRIDSQFAQLEPRFSRIDSQFAQLETRMAQFEARLMRWMLAAAGLGGLVGGLVGLLTR